MLAQALKVPPAILLALQAKGICGGLPVEP
jgi:hypothetical protein